LIPRRDCSKLNADFSHDAPSERRRFEAIDSMLRTTSRNGWLAGLLDMHEGRGSRYGSLLSRLNDSLATFMLGCLALGIGCAITGTTLYGLTGKALPPWTEEEIYFSADDPDELLPIAAVNPTRFATIVGAVGGALAVLGITHSWTARNRLSGLCALGLVLCIGPIVVTFLAMVFVVA
jgi:hypothetical protein